MLYLTEGILKINKFYVPDYYFIYNNQPVF